MTASAPLPGAPARQDRGFGWALAAVSGVGLAIRLWGLPGQPPLADDLNAALSAVAFVERGEISSMMWQHPRLRDLLVYAATALAGRTKLGFVLPSLAAGVLSIPVMGLLARRLAGPAAGLLAALLVAADPLHVHYSRQAVQDVYMFLFGAAGVLLALEYASSGRRRALAAAGLAFGLGVASKWAVLAPLAVTAAWLCARAARDRASRRAVVARLALVVAALGAVPLAVYVASWAPWFAHGRDLPDWLALQATIATGARTHAGFNPADLGLPHRAIRWFLWPTWYADATMGPQGPLRLVAVTNPLVWLLVLPSVALVTWRALRLRREEDALVATLFAATWLPFVLAARPIWAHSALAVLPFALAAVASAAVHLAGSGSAARRRLAAYAAAVALSSAPLLALATGFGGAAGAMGEVAKRFRPGVPIGDEAAGGASGAPPP